MTALAVVVVAVQARGAPTPHTHPLVMVVVDADTVLHVRVHLHATPSSLLYTNCVYQLQIKHQTSRLVSKQQNLANIHLLWSISVFAVVAAPRRWSAWITSLSSICSVSLSPLFSCVCGCHNSCH